jgi:hypothetical protein
MCKNLKTQKILKILKIFNIKNKKKNINSNSHWHLWKICLNSSETDLSSSLNLFNKNPTKMKSEGTRVQMAVGIKVKN